MLSGETYAIYLRKSRADAEAEARGEGETLARHERILLALARSKGLTVTQIYREIVSGETIAARPVVQQLLSDVEQGLWSGVLVMEVERLARGDTIDQGIMAQTFKYSDTRIITPSKVYDPNNEFDEEYFEFGLFMSRREYKTINRRIQRGRAAAVQEGKWPANKAPYGYRRVKLERDSGWTLEMVPEEAEVVRMIFDWYIDGVPEADGTLRRIGASLISRRLNQMGVPSATGGPWSYATVHDMLISPVYAGKVHWGRRGHKKVMRNGVVTDSRPRVEVTLYQGLHPAIVPEERWQKAQQLIRENPPRSAGERRMTNPLAGLIVCGVCGHKMVRRPYSRDYPASLICNCQTCTNVSTQFSLVEQRLLDSLAAWLKQYKVDWAASASRVEGESALQIRQRALKKAKSDLNDLKKQSDNIHNLLERGIYDIETFLQRSKAISDRLIQAEQTAAELERQITEESRQQERRRVIIPLVEHLLSVYDDIPDPATKNTMLKEVLEKATYLRLKGGRWSGTTPDDFELRIYPRMPKD